MKSVQRGRRARFRGALLHCVVVPVSLATVGHVHGQTSVRGTVVEDLTSAPIETVDLRLIAADGEILEAGLTDASGFFKMPAPGAGIYNLSVRRLGYATIVADSLTLREDEEIELLIRMSPDAVVLEAVQVVASSRVEPIRIAEFHERARLNGLMGLGRIYMREDIERFGGYSATDLLDRLTRVMTCDPVVLLDGLPTSDLRGIKPDDLEGIEIYRGVNQIPPRYYRYGMCGLALVWTRADTPGGKPLTWRRLAIAGLVLTIFALLGR